MAKRTLAILAGLLYCGGLVQGTPPPPIQNPNLPEVATRPVEPTAGYVRTNKILFLQRQLSERLNAVRPATTVVQGERTLPVICVEFANVARPYETVTLDRILFTGPPQVPGVPPAIPRTLTQYYKDMSNGKLTVNGQILGWYRAPKDDRFYENNVDLNGDGTFQPGELRNGDGPEFFELLTFGLLQADAEVDFGDFDNDGPDGVPNSGDDDGKVDTVFFVHPESGAECGTSASRTNIWSHFWQYSGGAGPDGSYVTDDVWKDENGNPRLNPNGTPRHILVSDYTIQPAVACAAGPIVQPIQIGVFCHEFGHALGLPDLYDRTNPRYQGVGAWCLMAAGSYGWRMEDGSTPVSMSAWCKYMLGWTEDETIATVGEMPLTAVEQAGHIYRLNVPGTNSKEYFLIEYRDPKWIPSPGSRINWDINVPEAGLVIWHVDERVGASSPRWPFAPQGQGQNDDSSMPRQVQGVWRFNSKHALVALVQKDRLLQLEQSQSVGDVDDLFQQGDEFKDDDQLLGGSRGYNSESTDISIKDIDIGTQVAVFDPGDASPSAAGPTAAGPAVAGPGAAAPGALALGADSPGPAGDVPPEAQEIAAAVQEMERVGTQGLSEQATEVIRSASDHMINALDGPKQALARKAGAQMRQIMITGEQAIDERVQKFSEKLNTWQQKSGGNLKVQMAPGSISVERVTGLQVPAEGASVSEDAQRRVKADLDTGLYGENVTLAYTGETVVNQQGFVERFAQTLNVSEKELPVWGLGTQLLYSEDKTLRAIESKTLPVGQLQVTGNPGILDADSAKQVAANQLGLPKEAIDGITRLEEGIYLLNRDPKQARVCWRVWLPVGKGLSDIRVLVDSETKQVIAIE